MTKKKSSKKQSIKLLRLPIYGSSLVIGIVAIAILLTGGQVGLQQKWPVLLFVFSLMFFVLLIIVIVDQHMSEEGKATKDDSDDD